MFFVFGDVLEDIGIELINGRLVNLEYFFMVFVMIDGNCSVMLVGLFIFFIVVYCVRNGV